MLIKTFKKSEEINEIISFDTEHIISGRIITGLQYIGKLIIPQQNTIQITYPIAILVNLELTLPSNFL